MIFLIPISVDYTKIWYVGGYLIALKNQLLGWIFILYNYKMKTDNNNNFDFLDDIQDRDLITGYKHHHYSNEWMKIKKGLFDFLDWFTFVDDSEKVGAICDFYNLDCPSYWELARASDIVDYYNEYLRLKSKNRQIDWGVLRLL